MDRPEPGLIKWSPSASLDSFIHINLQHRVVQVYEPTGHAQRGRFGWKKVSKHDDFPPLTAYDWSPSIPGLIAVGTSSGIVNLLRVDDGSNAYLELNLKLSRVCQAVAFNALGKLAVGLDRVRSDNCLYIWDVNRLSSMDSTSSGFPDIPAFNDPVERLEPSVSVSSVRFFEDNPNILVAGVKGHGLRMHDLRDRSHVPVATFQTKCCNNLAIDYADQNYFASSALDQPGIMVWDRRATSRSKASTSYLEAVDEADLPWGGALRLTRAMEMETDPARMDSKHSFIRSLKFCRDHPGMLAVLSRTGQLKVLSTKTEFAEHDATMENSPESLQVTNSHDLDPLYADSSRKHDKIVSFDWVTLRSPTLRPRIIALRANGSFDILEKPSFTSDYLYKLVPWQAPYRGLEAGTRYHDVIKFDSSQSPNLLAPLVTDIALSDIPLFGPEKADVNALVRSALRAPARDGPLVQDEAVRNQPDIDFAGASTISQRLRALNFYSKEYLSPRGKNRSLEPRKLSKGQADNEPFSPRDLHEKLLYDRMDSYGLPGEGHAILDHIMLLRAKEMYLLNAVTNKEVVADDPWLQDVWAWVSGAEGAAIDSGMMSHPLDLSYLGVYNVWMHDLGISSRYRPYVHALTHILGSKPEARLSEGMPNPDMHVWESCLNAICKKLGIPKVETVATKRPHHRQLCLDMCSWGGGMGPQHGEGLLEDPKAKDSSSHTMAAAQALFSGDTKQAVQLLKQASTAHPELLFVSLALQLAGKEQSVGAKEALDFDERVASKTDPYLRAISSFIASGDWAVIANQRSLPLRDRISVAIRYLPDDELHAWLETTTARAVSEGDVGAIALTGISDHFVDILARYVQRFHDYQTAALLLAPCAPRFIDDFRTTAFRNSYRAYLQRHRAFLLRSKFNVETTKRSKHHGRPTVAPPPRQIALRCVYCDAETTLNRPGYQRHAVGTGNGAASSPLATAVTVTTAAATAAAASAGPTTKTPGAGAGGGPSSGNGGSPAATAVGGGNGNGGGRPPGGRPPNPFIDKMVAAGVSCQACGRHLPRCVVCLEIVGIPRSDRLDAPPPLRPPALGPEDDAEAEAGPAARFPTFCLRCEHVLHLDHARQWFARHRECPVPECRCKCNFRANPELSYA